MLRQVNGQQIKCNMKNIQIDFPDCWEEVLPAEWLYLLRLRHKLIRHSKTTLIDVKREWCRFVLSNRGIRKENSDDYYILINKLALTLDWMWSESKGGNEVELMFSSTKNLLPEWKLFKGPLSHGSDLTFGEFRSAVMMMNGYNETQEPAMLQALCGILYRYPGKKVGKPDFDGRYREEFRQERINFYSDRMRMMPVQIQWGIYAWFAFFCSYLLAGTFIIDGMEISFESIFMREQGDANKPIERSLGMSGILFSVAESGIFGNIEKADDTLLLRVLMKLLDDKYKADAVLKRNH